MYLYFMKMTFYFTYTPPESIDSWINELRKKVKGNIFIELWVSWNSRKSLFYIEDQIFIHAGIFSADIGLPIQYP
jgi:hypothetical protein